jgi:hypothetical protein
MNKIELKQENIKYVYVLFFIVLGCFFAYIAYDIFYREHQTEEVVLLSSDTFKIVQDFKNKGVSFLKIENLMDNTFSYLENINKDVLPYTEKGRFNPFER